MHIITLIRYYRYIRKRKMAGIGCVAFLLLFAILGNTVCFYVCEQDGDTGPTFGDSLWYSVISVTTIGYGDLSATTPTSRLATFVFIVVMGLGSFTVLLGMAIDWITQVALREEMGMGSTVSRDHILVVNFPTENRVRQLIDELHADPHHAKSEVVIVSDQIDSLPFKRDHVIFIKGAVLEEETYIRADVKHAKMAIVLASSYSDPNSDAIAASASAVIDRMNSSIHLVTECLSPQHAMLFESVNCDAIVYSLSISANLLAQEVQDPGVAQMVDVITSNTRGSTLYSSEVDAEVETDYRDIAINLLRQNINLICVNREGESHTSFGDIRPQAGDRAIYAAKHRLSWQNLLTRSQGGS